MDALKVRTAKDSSTQPQRANHLSQSLQLWNLLLMAAEL
jgi:hypothetical protein